MYFQQYYTSNRSKLTLTDFSNCHRINLKDTRWSCDCKGSWSCQLYYLPFVDRIVSNKTYVCYWRLTDHFLLDTIVSNKSHQHIWVTGDLLITLYWTQLSPINKWNLFWFIGDLPITFYWTRLSPINLTNTFGLLETCRSLFIGHNCLQ